jgi:hypothetical protein
MMTQFNLQPPIKNANVNTTQRASRPAESQSLHVEIQGVYAKEIAPHIAPLQKKMKWYAIAENIALVIGVIVIVAFFLPQAIHSIGALSSLGQLVQKQPLILVVPVIGILSALFTLKNWLGVSLKKQLPFQAELFEWLVGNDYQTLIVTPLLKTLKPSLSIAVEGQFSSATYKNSQLFTKPYEGYFSSEVVSDTSEQAFKLGYVKTDYVTGSGKNRQVHIIFDGLMACIPCPKATVGQTFILPDAHEKKWGAVAKQLQGMTDHAGAKLVTMDNPDFEKAFQVYTTDSVQAHYLLSTKWLEKLTDFQRELKVPISIALHSGMCYVALHGYESPFIPQQDLQKALTASGVYTQYIRLKKLFDQLEILQQIGE